MSFSFEYFVYEEIDSIITSRARAAGYIVPTVWRARSIVDRWPKLSSYVAFALWMMFMLYIVYRHRKEKEHGS
jgi:hypothetical protein